jgi:hypothetical protein
MVIALEVVAVIVKYLARPFYMGLLPIGFNFSLVREGDYSKTTLFTVGEIALIESAVVIKINPLSVLLALAPHTLVIITVWIGHFSFSRFEIILPFAFIYIAI